MRSIAFIIVALALAPACKSSAEKSAAKDKSKQVAPTALADQGDEDDGAIEIPKELHSTVFLKPSDKAPLIRGPVQQEGLPRELLLGSKLQVKLRGVKNLKLGVNAPARAGKISLKIEGSNLASLEHEGGAKEFVIPMKGLESETLVIASSHEARISLSITQITALGGEIMEWKILAP